MTSSRSLGRLLAVFIGLALTLSLIPFAPAAEAARKPRQDYPSLPNECATRKEQMPQKFIFCQLNAFDESRPTVFLWGDSHAFQIVPALEKAARGKNVNLVAFMLGSCPPMHSGARTKKEKRNRTGCEEAGDLVFGQVKKLNRGEIRPKVIIALNWDMYMTSIENNKKGKPGYNAYVETTAASFRKGTPRLFNKLGKLDGLDLDVVAPVGQVPANVKTCKKGNLPYECTVPRHKSLNKHKSRLGKTRNLSRKIAGSRIIDVNSAFCNKKRCKGITRFKGQRVYTWYDDLHISATIARKKMSGKFVRSVNQADARNVDPGDGGGEDPDPDCTLPILCRQG